MMYPGGLTLEEKVNSLFQSDPLSSICFFDVHCRKSYLEPEKVLMLAVLEDAVTCIQKFSKGKRNRRLRETIEWIIAEDDDWPFSFKSICDALGFDATSLRLVLTDMAERKSAESHKAKPRRSQEPRKSTDRERIVRAAA